MSAATKAVFLSYASQDADAARRICDALRAAGVEVWFDQSELRGGDSWDQKIRVQIKECALFVPVISAATQARTEGYFRREWKLAVDRTHDMADHVPFLVPVVLDATTDREAHVPEKFREVQWTRLPGGETPPAFCARVQRLLGEGAPDAGSQPSRFTASGGRTAARPRSPRTGLIAAAAGLVVLGVLGFWQPWKKATRAGARTGEGRAESGESEARRLERQARALIDDDPLTVRENFRTAYELCERAVALSPDDGEIWATMARANCQLIWEYNERSDRQVAAARSQAERAIRLAPHSTESGLAMATFEVGNRIPVASVVQRLEALLPQAPDDRRILRMLVRLGEEDDNIGSARRWADRADALPGGDAPALVNLAWVYWGLNQYPELEAVLDRSLAIQRTSSAYHLKLMVLVSRGELTAAREWLQQFPPAILREDRVASVAYETFYYSRQPELALEVLARIPRDILEEGRYFAPRGYLAGDALLMAGKPRAAEVEYRAALKVIEERLTADPRNALVAMWKGRIMARLGNRDEAMRQFEVWREFRTGISVYDAENYLLVGQRDEAIAVADKLLDHARSRWPSAYRRLSSNPIYDSVKTDPRFQAILARGERWLQEMLAKAPAKTGEK